VADDRPASPREDALREDLGREYYALLGVVSDYDGRLMVVKGWSVTLSLAGLGLGFQQRHSALFALAALTALAFWYTDALMKSYQMRYYSRMRDIEVAAYHLNALELPGLGRFSAPRIDMSWHFSGTPSTRDWRADAPLRRTPSEIHSLLRRAKVLPNVLLPHAVAVLLGAGLFLGALLDAPGLADIPL